MGQLRPYPGFVGPSYTSQSKIAAYDRTVNWYPEPIESGTGTAKYWLAPTPGYETVLTLSDSPGRGSLSVGDLGYFAIAGQTFFQAFTSKGTVSNLTNGPAYMVTNGVAGDQVLIATDNNTYAYTITTAAFASVGSQTSTAYPTSIGFLSSYGLRLDPALSQVGFSAPNDFTSWDPLDVFQREDQPDRWMRLIVYHNEVWIFGEYTTSIYYLSDDTDIPFQPIQSAFIQTGIAAVNSACVVDGDLMWVGQTASGAGVVYRANGYTPQRVSTFAVEFAIAELGRQGFLGRAEGSTYTENGHVFYVLNFTMPEDVEGFPGATWVYDVTTGMWHERGGVWTGLQFPELDARSYFNSGDENNPQILTLSRSSGKLYQQSTDFSTGTNGLGIVRLRRAPHILSAQNRVRYAHLRVLMETGITTVVPPAVGSDPTIALRWSDDGGQTWSDTYTTSVGAIGQYSTLVDFWQLGQARDRIFEFRCSAPIPYRLIDAYLDYSVGPS